MNYLRVACRVHGRQQCHCLGFAWPLLKGHSHGVHLPPLTAEVPFLKCFRVLSHAVLLMW